MDLMEVLYRFGTDVTRVLNENKVKPPQLNNPGFFGGVICIVQNDKNRKQAPLAGSLNYNIDEDKWYWTDQIDQASPVAEEDEPG